MTRFCPRKRGEQWRGSSGGSSGGGTGSGSSGPRGASALVLWFTRPKQSGWRARSSWKRIPGVRQTAYRDSDADVLLSLRRGRSVTPGSSFQRSLRLRRKLRQAALQLLARVACKTSGDNAELKFLRLPGSGGWDMSCASAAPMNGLLGPSAFKRGEVSAWRSLKIFLVIHRFG